jgi:hypothetical protein
MGAAADAEVQDADLGVFQRQCLHDRFPIGGRVALGSEPFARAHPPRAGNNELAGLWALSLTK